MEFREQRTPQKLTHKFILNYQSNKKLQTPVPPCHLKTTPKNAKHIKKAVNPRTPKGQSVSYSVAACSSLVSANNSSVHSISMAVVHTPPAKRYHKVRNPFEAALAERLHLPLIASPSLFQRANTPLSSTQFEWTIDEVSSLKPANVEAHETQFQDSPDPELEAKAQTAISSYFKEQQIVPSPIDCPLRSQRIILSEINGNTPISKPGRRIRDCASQTELTLPHKLPPALEEALKPYFQPNLAGANKELVKSGTSRSWLSNNSEIKDTSLRRKLFDMNNIVVIENENQGIAHQNVTKANNNSTHSNSSPISLSSLQHTAIVGKLSDSVDRSSFGSLSPISATDSLSPNCPVTSATKRKSRFLKFMGEPDEIELLSPIHPLVRKKIIKEINKSQYRSEISKSDITTKDTSNEGEDNEVFSPERSSSPLNIMCNDNLAEFATDSFNMKVSRLKVNSSKLRSESKERIVKCINQSSTNIDIDDIEDILENTVDMDDMQISIQSGHSSNCSSTQADTPRAKRRSASRKNLSQSFSTTNWPYDDDQELETTQALRIKEMFAKNSFAATTTSKTTSSSFAGIVYQRPVDTTAKKNETFYRTDSGFNELSQNSSSSCEALKSQDVQPAGLHQQQEIFVCCSTPSKQDAFMFID